MARHIEDDQEHQESVAGAWVAEDLGQGHAVTSGLMN
jgi:hypothetical protein